MESIPLDSPLFTFSDVLSATGADKTWLRTFIQRDKKELLGKKHRTGRLLFSLNDIAAISILWGLNSRLRIAPSAAWQIVNAMGPIIARSTDAPSEVIHVGFDHTDQLFIWTVDAEGVLVTWNDLTDTAMSGVLEANTAPHFVIPMTALLVPIANAIKITHDWPEGTY